jgi:type II secretory pathway pseudopilin PulG
MMRRTAHRAGFTAVELLVVIGIAGAIGAALMQLFISFGTTVASQRAAVETGSSATILVDDVRDATLQATAVLSSHALSGTTFTTGTTTLVLSLPSVDASGGTVAGAYDYVAFYASGTSAYKTTDASGASVRTSGTNRLSAVLEALAFSYSSADVTQATYLTVSATTSVAAKGATTTSSRTERIYLRNI